MGTMFKELLHIPAVMARNIRAVTAHPSNVRHARITAALWGIATACSWINIGTDIISGDWRGLTEFPWVILTAGVAVGDVVMLRWSLLGLAWAKARQDEKLRSLMILAQFDDIIMKGWDK